jgi:prepilin signal peptidase PulO-like enzyme (type II secretory pathway)
MASPPSAMAEMAIPVLLTAILPVGWLQIRNPVPARHGFKPTRRTSENLPAFLVTPCSAAFRPRLELPRLDTLFAMSATDANVAANGPTQQKQDSGREPGRRDRIRGWYLRLWNRIFPPYQIPADVYAALEKVACSQEPVGRLVDFMKLAKTKPYPLLWTVLVLPAWTLISAIGVFGFVATGFKLDNFGDYISLVLVLINIAALISTVRSLLFDRDVLKGRLLNYLLGALLKCIQLENNQHNLKIRGQLARQLEDASGRFNSIYRRLPGRRAKAYALELKKHAFAGAQAIASMTSLLFAGPGGLHDLRERLARAILRIEPDDWLSVEQLGVSEAAATRKRSFRRLLEPSTVPLIVGALALTTAVVTLVGKMLDL